MKVFFRIKTIRNLTSLTFSISLTHTPSLSLNLHLSQSFLFTLSLSLSFIARARCYVDNFFGAWNGFFSIARLVVCLSSYPNVCLFVCTVVYPLILMFFHKNGPFPASFLYFRLFNTVEGK